MKNLAVGGHLSAATGLRHLVLNARALGYNVVQTMLGEPRNYDPFDIEEADVEEFKKMAFGIQTFVHLPYVINPCEFDSRRTGFYKSVLKKHLRLAGAIGARGAVIHPGFKKENTAKEALDRCLAFLEGAIAEDETVDLLLETDAGSKNKSAIGSAKFIAAVIETLKHPKVAMCMDTTHLYARGHNLWVEGNLTEFLDKYGRMVRLVHLNVPDHNVELGSNLDRHNTPFEERRDLNHPNLVKTLTARYPCVLERRSLSVQQMDIRYIREITAEAAGG